MMIVVMRDSVGFGLIETDSWLRDETLHEMILDKYAWCDMRLEPPKDKGEYQVITRRTKTWQISLDPDPRNSTELAQVYLPLCALTHYDVSILGGITTTTTTTTITTYHYNNYYTDWKQLLYIHKCHQTGTKCLRLL